MLGCTVDALYAGLDGVAETGAPLGIRCEDFDAARAVDRIEDELVRDCLREFIEAVANA